MYRKMHIPDDPLYYEKYYFTPGDLGFRAHDTKFGRIGTLVCWDQWYPEGARLTALRGADILFYPTAIGWHPSEKAAVRRGAGRRRGRRSSARTPSPTASSSRRSIASATRGRRDGGIEFWGGSFVADPFGIDRRRRARAPTRRSWSSSATARASRRPGATGRSCAIGASTPTAPITSRYPRRERLAMAAARCPPSGRGTRRPGSPGRTTRATGRASSRRFAGSTASSCACWRAHERVRILVANDAVEAEAQRDARARRRAGQLGHSCAWPTNRSWTRDTGPAVRRARRRQKLATHWRFNAWAKYDDWQLDVEVAPAIARAAGVERDARRGARARTWCSRAAPSTSTARARCWRPRSACRTRCRRAIPSCRRARAGGVLRAQLGAERVVWLGRGIAGDDTHGHIDDLARFVAPGARGRCARSRDGSDENYRALAENRERLRGRARRRGAQARGHRAADAARARRSKGGGCRRATPTSTSPTTWCWCRRSTIRPTARALGILGELFPAREVVGIHCVDLVWGLGTLHCMTQQEPA